MIAKLNLVLLAVLVIFALSACGSKKDTAGGTNVATPAPAATTGGGTTAASPAPTAAAGGAATVDAQAIFKQNCVACHGDNLEGKLGPNTNLTKIGATKTRDQIITQIKNGGGGMPPFGGKLKDQEINALADWLSAKK